MKRDRRRLRLDARRVSGGKLAAVGTRFERIRRGLLQRYECTACKGSRIELVAGVMMGPYYRFCRGCDGRGFRVHDNDQERLQYETEIRRQADSARPVDASGTAGPDTAAEAARRK